MTAEKSVHFEKVVFESTDDIKAHEGAKSFRRIWNMFINPMGAICKVAVIVVLLIFVSAAGGCGNSENNASDSNTTGKSASKRHVPLDTLVVKGLYMGMPGDDALEACKEMVASSKDLVVVDFRKGFEVEREVGLGKYEEKQEAAWFTNQMKRADMSNEGVSESELVKMGLKSCSREEWMKAHPPSEKEVAESKKKIKEVLNKKNLIQISFKKDGVREDKLKGLCFVWIDDKGNVKEVYFNEDGMARLFNAGDLSSKEFAQSLVDNYAEIPSLESKVQREDPGRGFIQTTTWVHKDPRGFQVKLSDRAYFNNNGQRYTSRMLENDPEVNLALSLADKSPKRYLSITAIKPASARRFD